MQNQPIHGLSGSAPASKKVSPSEGQGPAFRALLEALETQSRGLAQSSETMADAAGLVDAVGQSEKALQQAKQLTDQLLEAFRAEHQRRSA